jgi:tetrahydromethanopterin:alpha-L-glutamate ligase
LPRQDDTDLAIRAAAVVGAQFAGVDLIRGRDDRASVLEVNSMPGWRGLQSVTHLRIADVLAGDFLGAIDDRRSAATTA